MKRKESFKYQDVEQIIKERYKNRDKPHLSDYSLYSETIDGVVYQVYKTYDGLYYMYDEKGREFVTHYHLNEYLRQGHEPTDSERSVKNVSRTATSSPRDRKAKYYRKYRAKGKRS